MVASLLSLANVFVDLAAASGSDNSYTSGSVFVIGCVWCGKEIQV